MRKKHFIFIILMFLFFNISAQQIVVLQDFETWTELGLRKKINKRFEIRFDEQIRLNRNSSQLNEAISEILILNKINKKFKVGAGIRYAYYYNQIVKVSENRYRYFFQIQYKTKLLHGLSFRYRVKLHRELTNFFRSEILQSEHVKLRNKIGLQYDINKIHAVYISSELFRKYAPYFSAKFNQVRSFVGYRCKTDLGLFNFAFGFEQEMNINLPKRLFLTKLSYSLPL